MENWASGDRTKTEKMKGAQTLTELWLRLGASHTHAAWSSVAAGCHAVLHLETEEKQDYGKQTCLFKHQQSV